LRNKRVERHCQHDEFGTSFARLSRIIHDNSVIVVW